MTHQPSRFSLERDAPKSPLEVLFGSHPPLCLLFLLPLVYSCFSQLFCLSPSQHSAGTLSSGILSFSSVLHLSFAVLSLPYVPSPLTTALFLQLAGYFRHAFPKMRYAFPGKSGHRMHLGIISTSLFASHRLSMRVHWAPTRQSMASTHQHVACMPKPDFALHASACGLHVALHRPLRPLCDSFKPLRASAWL